MSTYSRIEIIANQAVEEDIFDRLAFVQAGNMFTRISPVYGKGNSGQRLGNPTWPEENIMLIIYCSSQERDRIIEAISQVKKLYPEEGIKLFCFEVEATIL